MAEATIYLDNHATTPVDPRVLAAMLPFFEARFGNPHSTSHRVGADAATAVERARAQVAALIGAEPREIVFTSGATEANNLAIKGAARFHAGRKSHLITFATEHKCVLESARRMEEAGYRVSVLPVGPDGLADPAAVAAAIVEDTLLVSLMAVNNEIGVVQPLAEVGAVCRARGVYLHTDAAQAVGRIPVDVNALKVDLLSLSGHKVYGPRGMGALYVRRRPRIRLRAEMDGGGQERGFRAGTLPAPLCVGLGEACALAQAEMAAEARRLEGLRDRLWSVLSAGLPDIRLNGHPGRRVAGNLNLTLPGVRAQDLIAAVPDIAVSTGSACTSASVEPSYVLRAIGLSDAEADCSLRVGLGRFTTEDEVERAGRRLVEAARGLRGDAPVHGPAPVPPFPREAGARGGRYG